MFLGSGKKEQQLRGLVGMSKTRMLEKFRRRCQEFYLANPDRKKIVWDLFVLFVTCYLFLIYGKVEILDYINGQNLLTYFIIKVS